MTRTEAVAKAAIMIHALRVAADLADEVPLIFVEQPWLNKGICEAIANECQASLDSFLADAEVAA